MRRLALLLVLASSLVSTAAALDAPAILRKLDEAERVREPEKARSRQLLDEVQHELATSPDPLLVARAELLECTWADDPQTAYRAFEKGFPAAKRAGSVALEAKLTACRAYALWFEGKEAEAEREFGSAAALARKAGDEETEASALSSTGSLQYPRGAMADALSNLQAAYRIAERRGFTKLKLDTLTVIANVYADAKVAQYDRAIEYYDELLAAYQSLDRPADVADTLFNLGATLETKGELQPAIARYRSALALFQRLGREPDVAFTKRALGSVLMKAGDAKQALGLLDQSLAHYEKEKNAGQVAMTRHSRGMALRRLGRPEEALRDLTAARVHFEGEKNTRFLERNVEEIAQAYAQLGDWKYAWETGRRHDEIQQQLATARREELASRLRVEFDVGKKEQENRALARENALRTTALAAAQRSQVLQRIVIALVALLALTLAILFWRQVVNARRVRAMAMTDELTRLPNRRHILTVLESVFTIARKHSRPVAVIVFDIDKFKRINDTWGHAAGDIVLKTVARTCRLALRPSDHIGRTGGEEFLVVLHEARYEQAREIAERLRSSVEQVDFSSIEPGLRVTISLGVWLAREYDSKAAIAAADMLLYRAKESGRNRVEMAPATA